MASLPAGRGFLSGWRSDSDLTAAPRRLHFREDGSPYRASPDFVPGQVHMQPVGDEEVFGPALVSEHRRDDIDVVQVRALAGTLTQRLIHPALKRKLRKAQLGRFD